MKSKRNRPARRARQKSNRFKQTKRSLLLSLVIFSFVLSAAVVAAVVSNKAPKASAAAAAVLQTQDNTSDSTNGAISQSAIQQIESLIAEKDSRTPVEQKIDSQLLYAIKMSQGEPITTIVQTQAVALPTDAQSELVIDVTANVSESLLANLKASGATVVSSFPEYDSLRLQTTLDSVEAIASLAEVRFIQPKQEPLLSREGVESSRAANASATGKVRAEFAARAARVKASLSKTLANAAQDEKGLPDGSFTNTGRVNSEGDVTHKANRARATFNVNGSGVKIGVLSDGAISYQSSVASGDLPPDVTILPGQAGSGDEGTAMMEIIYDLAPGAKLFFATGNGGPAVFANNIRNLRAAGCDIIVDDLGYFVESPFQDGQTIIGTSNTLGGVVTQAVNDVTASGALYFSSAGNSGNKNDGTAGVWEGDFADGGAATFTGAATGSRVHNFNAGGTTTNFDTITAVSSSVYNLFWSDPLGASSNDYDLFVLNSTGTTVITSSTNLQTGTQDPYEQIAAATTIPVNSRLVIVKKATALNRYLHLNTNRGRLAISTAGQTHGHSSAALAYSVAATPAVGPFPNPFNSSNVSETFTSDGPRRLFYNPDGTPKTPTDVSSTGGELRQKPDITAADGVSVTGAGGFSSPFFGTSAAAPHAAAIAGLLKSAKPDFSQSQIRSALNSSAVDIETPGVDRDTGVGIILAFEALQAAGATGTAGLDLGTVTATEVGGNGNGFVEPGERGNLSVQLRNVGVVDATNVTATLTTTTPGVTVTPPGTSTYPDIPANGGAATNNQPFEFVVGNNASCPSTINFTLTVNYTGGPSPKVFNFTVTVAQSVTISTTLDAVPPPSGANYTATTGMQTGRLARSGVASNCTGPKANPGQFNSTSLRYDAYTFQNTTASPICVTVTLSGSANLFSVAYAPTFVPTNVSQNFIGDSGGSNTTVQYSFNVPANTSFVVVVHEVAPPTAPATTSIPYTLKVDGLPCAAAPANQPPVNTVPGAQSTNEDTSLVFSSNNNNQISVADPDAGNNPLQETLSVTNGTLTLASTRGLTFTSGNGTNNTTMTFTGSQTDIDNALNGLTYTPTANFNGAATLTITSNDQGFTGTGGAKTDTDTVTINVAPGNDAPVASDQTVTTNEDTPANVTLTATDIDNDPLTYRVVAGPAHGTLSGTAPNLTYTPALDYNGTDSFTFVANDGTTDSNTATVTINITAVNDAPVNTVPGAQQTNQNTSLVFSSANNNRISIADVDAGDNSVRVTLIATNGTVTVAFPNGNTTNSTVTFNGNISALNSFLDGVRFNPTPNFSGTATLTITTDDQGNTGAGGAQSDTDTIQITVNSGGTLQFSAASYSVSETGGNAAITVTRTNGSAGTASVAYTTSNGTATAGADYTTTSGTLSFADGETSKTFNVPIIDDSLNEGNETINLTLSNASGTASLGTQSSAALTVVDNDTTPGLSINNTSVTEGNGGTVNAVFTVTLSAASGQTVSVNYATANGTATAGSDYVATNGTLTFNPGETTKNITVLVNGDALNEPDETFFINLTNPSNAAISGAQGAGTIINDDAATGISINDATVTEGNSGTVNAVFTLTLAAPSGQVVTVAYATANNTATAGSDYVAASGTVTFNPGETTKTVSVTVNGDTTNEATETFFVNLTNATNATITRARGIGTITDDDGAPTLSINSTSVTETNSGTVNAVFTVTLSAASGQTVTVSAATADGTASAGSDYQAASATLTFNPGETTKTFNVLVNGDTAIEPDENFFVNLTSATNAAIAGARGTGTITNDDFASTFAFSAANYNVDEAANSVTITVTRTGGTAGGVSIDYATSDISQDARCDVANGQAAERCDYQTARGTLVFASGETSKTFNVLITDDVYAEGIERFNLSLGNAMGGVLGAQSTATVTIMDNDATAATTNPIDDARFFVRQQYRDFLNREPDAGGFDYWTNQITECGSDQTCISRKRRDVSAAFFIEQEFQQTGAFVYRFYKASFGIRPTFVQFFRDRGNLRAGSTLEADKLAFALDFVQRDEFQQRYLTGQSAGDFIDALLQTVRQSSGIDLRNRRAELLAEFNAGANETDSRARVVRKLTDYPEYVQAEFNPSFVLMEYFGYLRRDPDEAGFNFWLDVLNNRTPGNYRSMVCAFITSREYQLRFSPVATRTDRECQ